MSSTIKMSTFKSKVGNLYILPHVSKSILTWCGCRVSLFTFQAQLQSVAIVCQLRIHQLLVISDAVADDWINTFVGFALGAIHKRRRNIFFFFFFGGGGSDVARYMDAPYLVLMALRIIIIFIIIVK